MQSLMALLGAGTPVPACRPWPRAVVSPQQWSALAAHLMQDRFTLLGLWGDEGAVHMALFDETESCAGIATCLCPDGTFPSVAQVHVPAARLERTIHDLFGLKATCTTAEGADERPWLDHGRWGLRAPLGAATDGPSDGEPYAFLAAEGAHLHQIPVGPVHAGIIEPGHFRFHALGETVVRLEERLGYVHKGLEARMRGALPEKAARLAGRLSGDSTVAATLAFSQAVESALGVEVPARAILLRAVMAELERLANHFGDIGAICNDAAFAIMLAHCGVLREQVLRAADACFGHRLMMDRIKPGGVRADLSDEGIAVLRDLVRTARETFPALVALYGKTSSILDRTVTTGHVRATLVRKFGAGGFVGRASGRAFDARRALPYAPYDQFSFEVPVLEAGDVDARLRIRVLEVDESLALITRLLESLPQGPVEAPLPPTPPEGAEGVALVESFRGDLLAYIRLDGEGRIARAHLRDASWFQWPLLEAAIEGNIVADFPLCNKSFNCSYSGHDL
ncbi:hydrogenase large subunit [Xanthobacter sp. TB0136]|uniref:hydrogenase large subunit n=1 Tax=Xanthobacter sp. TB0136 TaxID=3459177 RepID=UPI004039B4AD